MVSAPVRLHSVALESLLQLIAFAAFLERTTPDTHIHHLFIAINEKRDMGVYRDRSKLNAMSDAYSFVLDRASTTLLTLSIYHYDFPLHLKHSRLRFPVLRDLSLCTFNQYEPDNDADYPFPTLQRAHISTLYKLSDVEEPFAALASMAPNVAVLRMSGVSEDPRLPLFLRTLLRAPSDDAPVPIPSDGVDPEVIAKYLPQLRTVIVEATQFEDYAELGLLAEEEEQNVMMARLTAVAEVCATRRNGEPKLHLIPPRLGVYTAPLALAHWLDVIGGGEGPWVGWTAADELKTYEPPPRSVVLAALYQV